MGTFQGFLWEGDLLSFVLGKFVVWQYGAAGTGGRLRKRQEEHLGSWEDKSGNR